MRNFSVEIKPRKLKGVFEITVQRIGDSRGYFARTYCKHIFIKHGLQTDWIQENQSLSTRMHTIRGLHFQRPPYAETKFVRALQGAILDVFVDLRRESETYGQWDSIELSADNDKAIYIPRGFAHGFCTLTESAIVHYKVDNTYAPDHEGGIRWNDPHIGIAWNVQDAVLSERDQNLPFFPDSASPF
jgi:dTDP-4-dehydrorhamnose 3,5-epimerase